MPTIVQTYPNFLICRLRNLYLALGANAIGLIQ
nr:MAG TPA: hypothetical protein [Caudoviricetes sp.]